MMLKHITVIILLSTLVIPCCAQYWGSSTVLRKMVEQATEKASRKRELAPWANEIQKWEAQIPYRNTDHLTERPLPTYIRSEAKGARRAMPDFAVINQAHKENSLLKNYFLVYSTRTLRKMSTDQMDLLISFLKEPVSLNSFDSRYTPVVTHINQNDTKRTILTLKDSKKPGIKPVYLVVFYNSHDLVLYTELPENL